MKKNKNIIYIIISIIISIIGGLIVYYLKSEEIQILNDKIKKIEQENKYLKKKVNDYKIIVSEIN